MIFIVVDYFRRKLLLMTLKVNEIARALIFDLDGTLSDSLPVHVATWNFVGEKYGFEFDPQIIYEMTGMPTIEFARRVISQYNLDADPHEIVQMKQQAFWKLAHLLQPIEEVFEIVRSFYGKLPMSVGTGAGRKSAAIQLETLDILKYFDFVVSADDVTRHKPEPETFLECARLMGVDPQFCHVFEDGDLGIEAAKKAGMMVTDVRPFINYGEWAQQ